MIDRSPRQVPALLRRVVTRRTVIKGAGATIAGMLLAPVSGRARAGTLASPPPAQRIAGVSSTFPQLRSVAVPHGEPRSLSVQPITAAVEPDISGLRYTRAVGEFPTSAGTVLTASNLVAFNASESALSLDLDGDGQFDQSGVFLYHRDTDTITYAGVDGVDVHGVSDRAIAFSIGASHLGLETGDEEWSVPGFLDLETGEVVYLTNLKLRELHLASPWMNLSGDRFVLTITGRSGITYYDISNRELIELPVGGFTPTIGGDIVAFGTATSTLGYIDLRTGESVDTGEPLAFSESDSELHLTVSGNYIAFTNNELALDRDLDGDGNLIASVVGVYDLTERRVTYLPVGGSMLAGDQIVWRTYVRNEGRHGPISTRVFVYSLTSGQIQTIDLAARASVLGLQDNVMILSVSEADADVDLNGDGAIPRYANTLALLAVPVAG